MYAKSELFLVMGSAQDALIRILKPTWKTCTYTLDTAFVRKEKKIEQKFCKTTLLMLSKLYLANVYCYCFCTHLKLLNKKSYSGLLLTAFVSRNSGTNGEFPPQNEQISTLFFIKHKKARTSDLKDKEKCTGQHMGELAPLMIHPPP